MVKEHKERVREKERAYYAPKRPTQHGSDLFSRVEAGTATIAVDTELYIELQKVFDRVVKNRPDPLPMYLTIQPLGEAAIQKAEKHGGNVLGMSKQNQACKLSYAFCPREWQSKIRAN